LAANGRAGGGAGGSGSLGSGASAGRSKAGQGKGKAGAAGAVKAVCAEMFVHDLKCTCSRLCTYVGHCADWRAYLNHTDCVITANGVPPV